MIGRWISTLACAAAVVAVGLVTAPGSAQATPGALDRHGCHGHGSRHHCHRGMAGRHFVGYGGGGYHFAHKHGSRWHHRRHRHRRWR